MKFKVGQIVVLENTRARRMGAHIGATAKVVRGNHISFRDECISVEWIRNEFSGGQSNGGYPASMFALCPQKGEQLLFNFMYGD